MITYNNWDIFNDLKNVELTEDKKRQLERYCEILLEENAKYNLTAIRDVDGIFLKHFYDSLIFTNDYVINDEKICDIGTGPGLPGMVLKIVFPNTKIVFIESNNKKINFLKMVATDLGLNDIEYVADRAEEYTLANRECVDIVISRAMAALNILLEVGSQCLKIGGDFIALKSAKLDEELKALNNQEAVLGLEYTKTQHLESQELGIRNNIFYKKTKKTPKLYPRMYSQIKKRPIGE